MRALRCLGGSAAVVALVAGLLLGTSAEPARAAGPNCPSSVMYVAAHADDTLLFQSPSLLRDVRSGRCVQTVFLTAGDAGKSESYWKAREEGAEAGYAEMLGTADEWTGSQIDADGHSVRRVTLDDLPRISIVYMRLPDGGVSGAGFPAYGDESLAKLWRGGNGLPGPTIGDIEAVDGSENYDYQELVDAVADLIESFGPTQIPTQDYTLNFSEGDHADHVATAYFVEEASERYDRSHRLLAFQGYDSADRSQNVFGALLAEKSEAFYAYGAHDSAACADAEHCEDTDYAAWLLREYVEDSSTFGAVAHAGYPEEAGPGDPVSLDGAESSGESGGALSYSWVQTGGPQVKLSGAKTSSPSFLTPPHPTLLTFSLTVADGAVVSEPDFVRVRVPGSSPEPVAVAGPDQSVESGTTVTLDGSGSWDPDSLPLQYSWAQVGGPAVALTGAATATPSFVAPAAAGVLRFSLAVSNGTQGSAPSVVAVEVRAKQQQPGPPGSGSGPPESGTPAPGKSPSGGVGSKQASVWLSRSQVRLTAGKASRQVVKVLPRPTTARCTGTLPKGVSCRVTPRRDVVIEATRKLKRVGTYQLWVRIVGPEGPAQQQLLVQVGRSSRR